MLRTAGRNVFKTKNVPKFQQVLSYTTDTNIPNQADVVVIGTYSLFRYFAV
jgi:hypothetical protein